MENNKEQKKTSRAQRVTAGVLTVLFLAVVCGFGLYGVLEDPMGVINSVRFHKAKAYLQDPEDTGFFPMTQARIASLENRLGKNLPMKDELSVVNASFQYALGKDMVVQGAEQLLTGGTDVSGIDHHRHTGGDALIAGAGEDHHGHLAAAHTGIGTGGGIGLGLLLNIFSVIL